LLLSLPQEINFIKIKHMKKLYTLAAGLLFLTTASQAQVVISQVYGGGGNTGATYKNDFVELYNRGTVAVTLTGHTLQYASSTGTFNAENVQTLPNITLQPGQYYLIQELAGAGGTTNLPSPDLVANESDNFVVLALAGANGKIALVSNGTPITSATGSTVVDFVGYGTANIFEGSGAVVALTNTTAALRASNGCQDTNNNSTDFVASEPTPRNTSTPVNICGTTGLKSNEIEGLAVYPNPLTENVLHVTSNSNAVKSVAVYDVLGKQVINTTTANGEVNASNLNAGVYIVKITEAGKTATKKLVVR
jgi:hypothetical protein